MVVQYPGECAADFAKRLENMCQNLSIEFEDKIQMPPVIFLTSASDGRQTATLQFITNETHKTTESVFNMYHIRMAHEKFQQQGKNGTSEMLDDFVEFLIEQKIKDYIPNKN